MKIATLEKNINAHLASLPADKRPESITRSRIQSVAISASAYFEATDREGHTQMVARDEAAQWLKI